MNGAEEIIERLEKKTDQQAARIQSLEAENAALRAALMALTTTEDSEQAIYDGAMNCRYCGHHWGRHVADCAVKVAGDLLGMAVEGKDDAAK